jgi:hypothetical protein
MYYHNFYSHLLEIHSGSSSFWEPFFSELFAGLIVLFIGSLAVPRYLDWRRRPHLSVINPVTRSDDFQLTKASDGFWEATLEFVIKNQTDFTQREWFWHIFIPAELNPQFESLDQTIACQVNCVIVSGKSWRHYFGNSSPKEVIFPRRTLRFNYRIKVKTSKKERDEYKIHYYFITEFGNWPKKADQIETIAMNLSIDQSIVFTSDYLASVSLKTEGE